jgi:hypothetical protein
MEKYYKRIWKNFRKAFYRRNKLEIHIRKNIMWGELMEKVKSEDEKLMCKG